MSFRGSRFDIRQTGRQILLLLALVALANGGFYLLWVRPDVQEYRLLLEENRPRFEELKQREEEAEKLEAFLAGLNRAEADLQRLRDEVLSTKDERMVDVQAELAELAQEFNIQASTNDFDNEVLYDEELERFVIVLPLEGGYSNLRKFLRAVEGSDNFLVVERVALAKGKQGGVMLSLDISLATYFNAPEELLLKGHGRRPRRRA